MRHDVSGTLKPGRARARRVRLLALALVPLLLPLAGAHPGDEFETLSTQSGDLAFYLTPQTPVVKAQREVVFIGEAAELRDQRYAPVLNATWTWEAHGPGSASVEAQPDGQGSVARVNFSAPGAWTLRVAANGTSVELPLRVYPATSVRAESTSLRYDLVYAGRETKASLYFLDDTTGSLVRAEGEVLARVERWENETRLAAGTLALKPGRSAGEHSFEYAFPSEGSYRVSFASAQLQIGFDDLPPFKVNVLPARLADEEAAPRGVPGQAVLVSLGCVALVALVRRRL